MRSHSCIACSALVLFLLVCGASVADRIDLDTDLTIEEARQLAQEFAMYDLADASVREEDRDGERLAVFEVKAEVGRDVEYTVNLSRGRIVWWRDRPRPSAAEATPATDAERISAEHAIAIVKEVATRALGEDVNAMTWTTPSSTARRYEVSGRRPAWGDPPRTSGLSPDVSARVSALGRVEHYHQLLPPEAPAEVMVTETQATDIALADAVERGIPEDDVHVEYVRLVQRGSRAYWDITVSDCGPDEDPALSSKSVIYEINAQTGEIESAGQSASPGWRPVREAQADDDGANRRAPSPAASASPTDGSDSTSPPWVLYGGIVLLCAIALGVFLLRRRLT
jgi:hypothetical protein